MTPHELLQWLKDHAQRARNDILTAQTAIATAQAKVDAYELAQMKVDEMIEDMEATE